MTEAYKYLGLERKTFKRMAEELGVYNPNQSGKGIKRKKEKIKLEDIFSNKIPYQSHKLKIRLIEENIFERKCYCCNLSEWLGQPIPLELHHIDGNHLNNNKNNLILLCPNCHALTDNYRSKNLVKKKMCRDFIPLT